METKNKKKNVGFRGIKSAWIVIVCCFIVAVLIYTQVLGNPANFMNNDPNNHPLPGNFLGTIYKGGVIVPVIQTLLLTVIALSIERFFAIRAAFGHGSLAKFVANIKVALANNDMAQAQALCDKQRGSVANVVGATLQKYSEMENNTVLSKAGVPLLGEWIGHLSSQTTRATNCANPGYSVFCMIPCEGGKSKFSVSAGTPDLTDLSRRTGAAAATSLLYRFPAQSQVHSAGDRYSPADRATHIHGSSYITLCILQ